MLVMLLGLSACSSESDPFAYIDATEVDDSDVDAVDSDPAELHTVPHGSSRSEEAIYPQPDWETGAPEDHGLSGAGLAQLAAVAQGLNSNCLVVIHEGVLVGEWYWHNYGPNTKQLNVWSVTKSVTSALVGIAQSQGLLEIDDSAADYIDEWAGTPAEAVTIRDLISNDSGRYWDYTTDSAVLLTAPNQTQFAIDLSQAQPPGSRWEYNNSAIQTLERVLEVATGQDVEAFAQENLFLPLGMNVSMGRDLVGNPQTFIGISASCRDLARFGYLYLQQGKWAGGQQIIPAAWVDASSTPSTPLNSAYGFMWWLNVPGHWVLPATPQRREGDGKLFPNAPEDLYLALGLFGQMITIDVEGGYVIVRLGNQDNSMDMVGYDTVVALWDAFAAAKL